ncbi:MAG: flagellar basal body-associated FliL family protein [Desulfobacterales bacterium]|nr:flagellar basal body-associated FliL family protein [Desulfobacterales bacterium]
MAQNLINEIDSKETTGVEGQAEAGSEPGTRVDAKTVKRWGMRLHKKVIEGLVIARQHKKVIAGLAIARQHKKVIAGLAIGLFMSPLVAYGLKHWHTHPGGGARQKVASTQFYRAPIKSDSRTLWDLAVFVVMLPEDVDQAYFSLSISARLSDSNLYREIDSKKPLFRGVIYGVLNKAAKAGSPQMVSKEKLKRDIIGALNGLLVTGTIDDIYFTDFLVV